MFASNHIDISTGKIFHQTTALPAVENLKLIKSDYHTVKIQWDSFEDLEMSNIKNYIVGIHKAGDTVGYNFETTKTSATLQSLDPGSKYIIKIKPVNEIGPGESNTIEVFTKLKAVEEFELVEVSENSVKLNWQSVEGADKYDIEIAPCCAEISGWWLNVVNGS